MLGLGESYAIVENRMAMLRTMKGTYEHLREKRGKGEKSYALGKTHANDRSVVHHRKSSVLVITEVALRDHHTLPIGVIGYAATTWS